MNSNNPNSENLHADAEPDATLEQKADTCSNAELLHELHLHQLELEMRDENLRQIYASSAEERDRYLSLYEFSPVGYLVLSSKGVIKNINLTGATLLGKEHSELLNQLFTQLISHEDRERWQIFFWELIHFDVPKTVELKLECGRKSPFHAQLNGIRSSMQNQDDSVHITLTDINDILHTKALQESEERFKLSMDATGDGLWDWNIKTDRGYFSPSYYRQLGYQPGDFPAEGEVWRNMIHPDDREQVLRANQQCIEGQSELFAVEFRMKTKAGNWCWILERGKCVARDAQGRALRLLGTHVDISQHKQKEEEQKKIQHLLSLSQQLAHIGSWEADLTTGRLTWSDEMYHILGFPAAMSVYLDGAVSAFSPDDLPRFREAVAAAIRGDAPYNIDYSITRPDGEVRIIHEEGKVVLDNNGTAVRMFGIAQDITEREKVAAELRIAATVFESQEGMMVTDANINILRVNKAFTQITGYSAEEVIGKNPRILQSGQHDLSFYAFMWKSIHGTGAWHGELWNRRKNGEVYLEHIAITAVKNQDGVVSHYVATFSDATQSKAAAAEIERLAFYDPLTALPNRRLLQDRLKLAFAASHRSGHNGALLFIDLDNFKDLNDSLGHGIGDMLLQQVAQRLSSCIRGGDTVARLGGDEFVVMLEDLSNEPLTAAIQTEGIAEKIQAAFNQNYQLGIYDYHCSPSIGAILFKGYEQTIDELLRQTDIAMYQAKALGRNAFCFFDQQMQTRITARVALEADLRLALAENQFQLYYQLQTSHNGHAIGAEALLRWQHPQRGLVPPDEFIPLAEETGLILPLGQWVLETACARIKIWESRPQTQHLQVAVNVSARQFHQADFVAQVCQILSRHAINPARLKLELTESLVLDNIAETIDKMNALRKIGVHFSMDDFGTGYSSLAYLTQLPLDQLKIDQSFVHNIGLKPSDAVIVQTIIGMAGNLGMEVIAEGVETEAQRSFLEQHGCLFCQGYLFSKPVPVEQFETLITQINQQPFP